MPRLRPPGGDAYIRRTQKQEEDAVSHRQLVDAHLHEIEVAHGQMRAGAIAAPDDRVVETQRENIAALVDLLKAQDRALAFALGQKVEPAQQFGEAVIVGQGS